MNKYNVRAIRSELDGYIRNAAWKKLGARLRGLDLELRRAVVEHRPSPSSANRSSGKKRYPTSLLHALCDCVHSTPPVPVDLLECILEVCPHLLSGNTSFQTPLAIALDRQAPPAILECLLLHDDDAATATCRSLYHLDSKTGDTPILHAIKQQASDDVILLLVEYDSTKESLLIPSKKRHRVPLFHVCNQELPFVNLEGGNGEIPGELEYMLLQTHEALQIQKGDLAPGASRPYRKTRIQMDQDDCDWIGMNDGDSMAFFEEEQVEEVENDCVLFNGDSQDEYCLRLLQAVFATAHLVGDKYSLSLISHLISQIPDSSNEALDKNGNTILHYLCAATHIYQNSALLEGRSIIETILRRHPQSEETANREGNLSFHIALESKKPWEDVLQPLLDAAPHTIFTANTRTGRLPLHLAISNYPSRSKEIYNVWKLYPEAAAIRDPSTKLFAFQLAAQTTRKPPPARTKQASIEESKDSKVYTEGTSHHKHRQRQALAATNHQQSDPRDLDQLSDIFFFLRASPQLIREFVG